MDTIKYDYYYERKNGDEETFEVTAEYSPEEPREPYYPGAPAELNVYSVKWKGREIINFFTDEEIEKIEDAGWEVMADTDYEMDEDVVKGYYGQER